jgi:uncharacterized protein YqjF (DUF2071 family)
MRVLRSAIDVAEAAVVTLASGSDAAAQARGLRERDHRPWPMPGRPWLQGQTWRDLLFAHWPLAPERLRAVVPDALPIDTFEGQAWIAITPFEVTGLRLRGTFPVPVLSRFAETNLRTYTTVDDRPGIYFFSLDAASALAVAAARATYRLPYFHARMSIERAGGEVRYTTTRDGGGASLRVDYQPVDPPFRARPGTLAHFLIERYCLYTVDGSRVRRAEIHHPPWTLRSARADIAENTMAAPTGLELPATPPLLHYAARQDVVIWPPEPVAPTTAGA